MLGDFIYSADVDDADVSAPCRAASPSNIEKNVRRFLTLAVIVIGGGLIWIFAISPCMVPAKVDVKSFAGLSRADALNIAGIGTAATAGTAAATGVAPYIAINAAEVERRLGEYYLVESAKVVKRFPDRVSIYLEPRRAVALVYARVNGRTQPVYFDRYGVAIGAGSWVGEPSPSRLPVVSGVIENTRQVGPDFRIAPAYQPLFARIGAISDEDPQIWQAISEIGIAKKDQGVYDVVLYPLEDSIRLRMRSDINKDSIYYALLMFDVCRQWGDAIPAEIDVRSGIGIVNAQEARFGK